VQPAEVVDSASTRQPTDPEQETEDFILLQSAISKTYRQKLLEFRRTVTPATLASMRAGLPPEHLPQLEMILREAAELGEDDEFEPFGSAAGPDAGASPLELSDEEQLAMDMLRDASLPSDFLR
jgi:hypothetical protein